MKKILIIIMFSISIPILHAEQTGENYMHYAKHGDAQIYYELHGEGSPLLLIAGLASDSQSWQSILQKLSENHRVIVFDNRTSGRTTSSEQKLTLNMMMNDAVGLLDHLGIEKADIAGHSMGGIIAMMIAAHYPDRVNKLIVAASTMKISERNQQLFNDFVGMLDEGIPKQIWFRNLFYWLFTRKFFSMPLLLDSAVNAALEYPYPQSDDGFRRQVEATNYFDGTDLCPTIQCPTLIIAGAEDIIFPVDECRKLSEAIPNASLRVIDGAAHSIHSEKPMEFVTAIEEFLR